MVNRFVPDEISYHGKGAIQEEKPMSQKMFRAI